MPVNQAGTMTGKSGPSRSSLTPIVVATGVSLVLYSQQALLLLLKVGEVFEGVFDTSVPAFPLAGMLFVLIFMSLRRREFTMLLAVRERNLPIAVTGIAMALLPMPTLLVFGRILSGSYVFAAVALALCWAGVAAAMRPSVFKFLLPYLLFYVFAVGSVSLLTISIGDPLAVVVAAISSAITHVLGLPVQWSSVYIEFVAAGGNPVNLYISQECSGIASIAIFLLVIGLMHLDVKPKLSTSLLFALGGAVLFILLNALRVVVVIWGGILGGSDLMWSLHGWVGYAFYILGYALLVVLYVRAKIKTSHGVSKHPPVMGLLQSN